MIRRFNGYVGIQMTNNTFICTGSQCQPGIGIRPAVRRLSNAAQFCQANTYE